MTAQTKNNLVPSFKRFSRAASVAVALVGCLVLLGWFDITILKSVFPGSVAMKANTALAFVLSALSLWLLAGDSAYRQRHIAQVCAGTVVLISLLTLAEHLLGWDLHVDQVMFEDRSTGAGQSQPGRMDPATAVMLLLSGVALSMLGVARADWIIEGIALATGVLSLLALAGYLSGISALSAIGPYSLAAPHAALSFIFLSVGILCARPDRGLLATITSDHIGGITARQLLPVAVGIPLVLGCLTLVGQRIGLYDPELGLALFALSNVVLFTITIFRNARALAQRDSGGRQAEREIQPNLERTRALREVDLAITSTLELSAIMDVLLEKVELFMPFATAATVRLLNRGSGALESVASRNPSEEEWRVEEDRALGGRAKKVLETKTPLTVRNVQTDPQTSDPKIYRKHGLVSHLGVPLVAKGEPIGVLGLYTKQEHEFTKEEIEFVSTLAGRAAPALYMAQLYQKIDLSRREFEPTDVNLKNSLKLLSGLYAALTHLTSLEIVREIIDEIIGRLMEATGADAALIRVWKKATGAYVVAGHRGFPDEYVRPAEAVLLGGAADWVVQHGEPIIAPDIASEPRYMTKAQVQLGFRSCATLPLKIHNDVRGILHLSSRKSGYFDEEQKDHLVAIAQQMGVVLENRELFDNLKASKDEFEKASKIKDEFLSVMSHELRTPLSVVMGYAGMIKEQLLGEINPRQEQALQKLLTRANEQLDMINAVMQATQLEAGALVLERQLVNLSDLLTGLKSDYESTHDKEKVALVWDYPSEPVPMVTDSGKLRQILANLISNGVKFTDQGSVTVSMRQTERRGKRWVELKVADTGVGIAKEQIPGIFDKFFQVDSSETRLYGGVGLGLYIVKRFAELLGGTVAIESEPGKGSTFTVTIPYAT